MTNTAPTITSSASVEIDPEKLRELRQEQGFKQTALAERCGISSQYVSQLETGFRKRVSPDLFVRLCDALSIPAGQRRVLRSKRPEVA
jgi:transcriptional regulator with XRE-family HTH domain